MSTRTAITNRIMPKSFSEETTSLGKLFTLTNWQYVVILGIAISGLAAFVNTYNAISNIDKNLQKCAETDALKKELKTQFIVILVLSILAVILGMLLAWFFRHSDNQRKVLTLGITTTGIFGILYAISMKLRNVTNKIKLGISWVSFVGFIILGFFISSEGKLTTLSKSTTTADTQNI